MIEVHAIPAFVDNYVWVLVENAAAVVVDPGDATPVHRFLDEHALRLQAILVTHHHPDHVGGLQALSAPGVPVYGPRAEAARIAGLTHLLDGGDQIEVLGHAFQVLALHGHTQGQIGYLGGDLLFCGDSLFSAGCGRLLGGTAQQAHATLQQLAALPPRTRVYCTHEYTMANLAFAHAIEPDNPALLKHIAEVRGLRAGGEPSLPTTIGLERAINPFLRTDMTAIRIVAERWAGEPLSSPSQVFAALRRWKDGFSPKAPPG